MLLIWLIVILMLGGVLAWISARFNKSLPRWISLIALLVDFIITISLWRLHSNIGVNDDQDSWMMDINLNWIPRFGVSFHLALDGLSILMILLTLFLGILSVLISWTEIKERVGFYYFNLMWILAGIAGVFLAMDLFLFIFFWEMMLIPMYFLIGIWGSENRRYAAYKFFLFTQASGLLMFLAILGLYFVHGNQTGNYSFDYFNLLGTELSPGLGRWLMLGFLTAFVVKLPVVPFHSWLPDAHSEAPTAGSVILAGLLLKTGAYGLLRFIIPLFPDAAIEIAPWGMLLGVIGILYGAILAFAQTDLKRLVAYTSVSHMGFVMLGVFAFNELAYHGVVMQMITHGISTGALFILAGIIKERIHTRDIQQMGGFAENVPVMGAAALIFAMASLGLPGLGNFIAEFLTLMGSWQTNRWMTGLAALGLVGATIYSLRIVQRVFFGPREKQHVFSDLNTREMVIMGTLTIAIVWLGLYPQPIIDTVAPFVKGLEKIIMIH